MATGNVVRSRKTTKAFARTPVPDETLAELLQLMQRAPSAYNMQPYVCVVVRQQSDRARLAPAMLHANGQKVLDAPVVVVVAADTEPSRNVPRIQQLKREHGVPATKVVNMPRDVRLFSRHGLEAGEDAPLSAPTVAWAFKQATFAAATLLFAAEELGLGACPMEGFDEARVREALEIPERYAVPVVIAVGYPKAGPASHATPRLPPTEVFFDGKFGRPSDAIFERK